MSGAVNSTSRQSPLRDLPLQTVELTDSSMKKHAPIAVGMRRPIRLHNTGFELPQIAYVLNINAPSKDRH